jgi:hypothetical protein
VFRLIARLSDKNGETYVHIRNSKNKNALQIAIKNDCSKGILDCLCACYGVYVLIENRQILVDLFDYMSHDIHNIEADEYKMRVGYVMYAIIRKMNAPAVLSILSANEQSARLMSDIVTWQDPGIHAT